MFASQPNDRSTIALWFWRVSLEACKATTLTFIIYTFTLLLASVEAYKQVLYIYRQAYNVVL